MGTFRLRHQCRIRSFAADPTNGWNAGTGGNRESARGNISVSILELVRDIRQAWISPIQLAQLCGSVQVLQTILAYAPMCAPTLLNMPPLSFLGRYARFLDRLAHSREVVPDAPLELLDADLAVVDLPVVEVLLDDGRSGARGCRGRRREAQRPPK